ncbi:hypothetical protein Hanom_Chr05g00426451 [Helianthus anomalus]
MNLIILNVTTCLLDSSYLQLVSKRPCVAPSCSPAQSCILRDWEFVSDGPRVCVNT